MEKLFNVIPSGFFNCLASGGNQEIYSDCLLLIYEQYEREISYRIARGRIRDAVAAYLLENHVRALEGEEENGVQKTYNDLANAVIRRFCSREVGWLEEDQDDATYEKHIVMTEQGILLAEFLQQLCQPEREEFSSYIYNIYNVLRSQEQWAENPYVNCLKNVYRNAKLLSKSLKRLSTFIKKIIERMVQEESLESLTENIIEYCEGDFIREYARLTKQQNIHIYRSFIRARLENMQNDAGLYEQLVSGCQAEEETDGESAEEQVMEMIQRTREFLSEDYDRIMRDIKHKINVYMQIAVGRARFLRSRGRDVRGSVEQTIRYIAEEMQTLGWKEELPEEMSGLFLLDRNEFLDRNSIRFPRKAQTVQNETFAVLEEASPEELEEARAILAREAYNPYTKENMKVYLERVMAGRARISSDELPMESRRDLLCALSAAAYGEENGYAIRVQEGYVEAHGLILRRFDIVKEENT